MNLRKDLIYNRSLILILKDEPPFFKIILFIKKMDKKWTKKVPKIPPSPAETEVLHKKYCIFNSKRPPNLSKN